MRRARIKALAAVPVRKKLVQDTLASTEINSVPNTEQRKDICTSQSSDTSKQEDAKDAAPVEKRQRKDSFNTDTFEQKAKNVNIQEKVIKNEQIDNKLIVRLTDLKAVAKKINSQAPAAREKFGRDSQETCVEPSFHTSCLEVQLNSKESCIQASKDPTQESPLKKKLDSPKEQPKIGNIEIKLKLGIQAKPDSQELCVQTKRESQQQAKLSSSRSCDQTATNSSEELVDRAVQEKILSEVSTGTDIVSPTKATQNRPCFMRPTPRLDSSGRIRKNSIQGSGASASESEDEHGKRTVPLTSSRVRNDSVCSVQSNKESVVNDNQTSSPRSKTTQKKRMLISESARKLAEARREFLLKHENKTPDRTQLKMYDLIYYNPVTNPMKKSTEAQKPIITRSMETQEEEDEDDPVALPVPQVKVGPDGQLIIDEQSLVIESSNAKRAKEILSTDVIVEDENCHSGGFYKKRQRGKDWPKWETFKFYRVLNVVGTDFLLMQTLFPDRTRQEIKQKYKKEERVNRHLIEKALKYHQEFDTEMLEEQLAILQNFENVQSGIKKPSEKPKNGQRTTKAARKRKHRLVATSIGECETVRDQEDENVGDEIDSEASGETNDIRVKEESKSRKLKRLDKSDSDKSDDNSFHASSKQLDSDSDPEIYQVRPTRSGRCPRLKKFRPKVNVKRKSNNAENMSSMSMSSVNDMTATSSRGENVTEIVNLSADSNGNATMFCPENIRTVIPNINNIEPGSLVILSRNSAEDPGNAILQVYMVSSNVDTANPDVKHNVTPINLPPKLLMTVTDKLEEAEAINLSNDCE